MEHKKNIVIWGYGNTGKSVVDFYLFNPAILLSVVDRKTLPPEDLSHLLKNNISICDESRLIEVFKNADHIIPSPGIDIRPYYEQFKEKWLFELDLFTQHWKRPIIAVTGSVGKTSTIHLMSTLISGQSKETATGGNIGTPMLSLIQQHCAKFALLELSSFQLEHITQFNPCVAIITNIWQNHQDRHSMDEYIRAKCTIFTTQESTNYALIPIELAHIARSKVEDNRPLCFFSIQKPKQELVDATMPHDTLYYEHNGKIVRRELGQETTIISTHLLPPVTFLSNWVVICSTLHMLGYHVEQLVKQTPTLSIPEHRMEKIIKDSIVFYNDSKSTTCQSTISAVESLSGHPILLFLGGLSKGVDRTQLIKQLKHKVKHIFCFGQEKDALFTACKEYQISASCHATLDNAFAACKQVALSGDIVLFSPSGSSYDLFENYQERGNHFKRLIQQQ